jgi:hypothetical protein
VGAFPSAYFRVGYVHKVFGEIKIGQQFPSPFPSSAFQTNVGFGFGKNNGGAIRIGTASYTGIFIAPIIPIGKHLLIEPYIGGFAGILNEGSEYKDQKTNFVGSISLRYKFGKKFTN